MFNFCLKNFNYPIQSDFLFYLCRLHIPALVTSSSGLSPAGGAGRCGGGWSSRQSGGWNLGDLLNLCSSYCCFLSTSSCCYSCCSSQRLVDAALSRELPADLFYCLANHLVLKLEGWRGGGGLGQYDKVFQCLSQSLQQNNPTCTQKLLSPPSGCSYLLHVRSEPGWRSLVFFFGPLHFFHDHLINIEREKILIK